MPQEDDSAELRTLQRRAYGRDGGLTDAEARRLQELEQRGSALTAPVALSFIPEREPESKREPESNPEPAPNPELAPQPNLDPEPEPRSVLAAVTALRRHWKAAAVASALLLAIGLGAGWTLFGERDGDITLTAEQQQRRLELYEKGDYDEGTVRAIAQDDEGALAWYGTKDDGAQACLVIDVGEESGQQCLPRGDVNELALSANVMLSVQKDADAGSDPDAESSSSTGVNAFLMFSATGEPMATIQRYEQQTYSWVQQFAGEDRPRAEKLMSEYDPMDIRIIGSFREEPVWLIDRSVDDGMETCLIIDAVEGESQCLPSELAINGGISTLVFVDDGAGGSEAWTIQVAYTVNQTPYLVITRDPTPASVSSNGTITEGDEPPSG